MKKIPAFVYKVDSGQVGNGNYSMVACFPALGVHVPYVVYCHSENEYLEAVGEPYACDDSCSQRQGQLEDFARERHDSDHSVQKIIDAAMSFKT